MKKISKTVKHFINNFKKFQNNLDKLFLDFEELKMRAQIEKTELEQRLASSIEHVAVLNQQVC